MAIIEKNNKTRKLEIRIITVKAFIRIIITALIQSFISFILSFKKVNNYLQFA